MATISDEQLSAFIDGELEPDQAERIARLVREDARLASRLDRLKAVDRHLREAVDQLVAGSPPCDLQALGDRTLPLAAQQGAGRQKFAFAWPPSGSQRPGKIPASANDNRWRLPLVASIAALAGIVTGQLFLRASPAQDAGFALADPLASDRQIAAMLENQPSGTTVALGEQGQATAQVRLSFVAQDGAPCREFTLRSPQERIDAVACRARDGAWHTRLAARSAPRAQTPQPDASRSYRTATSIEGEAFDAAVSSMMASDALDRAQERRMIEKNWPR